MKVLRLLQEGKISATEAADLLSALRQGDDPERGPRRGDPPPRPGPDRRWGGFGPHFLRVRVTDEHSGETKANVSVPLGMLGMGFGFARHLGRNMGRMDDLMEAVRSGKRGNVFDVAGKNGEHVEISID